jgi:hypothetical protein
MSEADNNTSGAGAAQAQAEYIKLKVVGQVCFSFTSYIQKIC